MKQKCLINAKEDEKGIAGQARNDRPFRMKKMKEFLFALLVSANCMAAPLDSPDLQTPFVFVTRYQYRGDHHNTATFFPAAENEFNTGRYVPGGALKKIDFNTGKTVTLLETADGVIRDPEVHFDGHRIVFSMRRNKEDSYHIYEINTDGSGLKQLTFMRDVDDIDPFYLADDHIAFSSTREPKYCMCNRHIMANLYRMNPDGSNIYQISKNTLFDGHGHLMPDGRILYDRWEYVDRNYGDGQSLWTCNPDGTNHVLYWGNNTPSPGGVIDARIMPDINQAVCVFTSCHDRPWGAIAIIDRRIGTDGRKPVAYIWPEAALQYVWETNDYANKQNDNLYFDNMSRLKQKFEDPFPLNERYLICSGQVEKGNERMGLYLLDIKGENSRLLYEEEKFGCFDPVPVVARPRPPEIPTRRNFTDSVGYFYVLDVYKGTHIEGVKRGEVKYLRIVETPEKRFWTMQDWGGQGAELPAMNWDDFNNKKIIGTVPVNEDGSAYFEVPAEKFVYFQLLDKDGQMIQSMRSGTMVQPGEHNGCVGCHESRTSTPSWEKRNTANWAGKPLKPYIKGKTAEFSYMEEVQPVFDRHCVQCHQPGKKAGKALNLLGSPSLVFNPSYAELWIKGYIRPVGAGPAQNISARAWGSSGSKLIATLRKKHAEILLDSTSLAIIATWIDLNAPYYPSYATSYPNNPYGRSPLSWEEVNRLKELTGIDIAPIIPSRGSFYYFEKPDALQERDQVMLNAATAINFDHPEKSPALQNLKQKSASKYEDALKIIALGQQRIKSNGANDRLGFTACPVDQWREQKYLERRAIEQSNRQRIIDGRKNN
jgi:hypothetical protein